MVAIPGRTHDLIGPGWQQGLCSLAQCQYPKYYNGMEIVPLEGKSLVPTETPSAPLRWTVRRGRSTVPGPSSEPVGATNTSAPNAGHAAPNTMITKPYRYIELTPRHIGAITVCPGGVS